jgi:hypothetical protein
MASAIAVRAAARSCPPSLVLDNVFRGETGPFKWHYAVLPDAHHLGFARSARHEPLHEIRRILNGFEELKAKVPARW